MSILKTRCSQLIALLAAGLISLVIAGCGGGGSGLGLLGGTGDGSTVFSITNSATLSAGNEGIAYTTTFQTENGVGANTWTAPGLPTGWSLDQSTGVLTGPATSVVLGTYTFTVSVTDSSTPQQSAQKDFSVTIYVVGGGPSNGWAPMSTTNAPAGRVEGTAIWTGTEMIVWGGQADNTGYMENTGGRYNPSSDSWTATSTTGAPSGRKLHTAVWDTVNSQMIVFGGFGFAGNLGDGGIYDPSTDSWSSMVAGAGTPSARSGHVAVWTGTQMIVWSGHQGGDAGGVYDPTSGWVTKSVLAADTGAPTWRQYGHAVWDSTAGEMIIWGGFVAFAMPPDTNTPPGGGRYDPLLDQWTTVTGPAQGRMSFSMVWAGTQMIAWGGIPIPPGSDTNTGDIYTASGSWLTTSLNLSLTARESHTAVWTGDRMIVWGGAYVPVVIPPAIPPSVYYNDGASYNPVDNAWTTISSSDAPVARYWHVSVWTGAEMLVWGGGDGTSYLNSGGRYTP